jgi:DNA-directed RNA polymerase specialized sigma24 family protein
MPLATTPLVDRQARYERMLHMRKVEGKTYQEIARIEKVPRQLVWRILNRPMPERQYGGRPRKVAA